MIARRNFREVAVWIKKSLTLYSFKLKSLRTELEKLTLKHNSNIMEIGGKLGELQKIKDKLDSVNSQLQEKIWNEGEKSKERLIELSRIFWGINNLAEKSLNNKTKPISSQMAVMNTEEKLNAIKVIESFSFIQTPLMIKINLF